MWIRGWTTDHILFPYWRVVQMWPLAMLLSTATLGEQTSITCLEALCQSMKIDTIRSLGVRVTYIAYQIWLSRKAPAERAA